MCCIPLMHKSCIEYMLIIKVMQRCQLQLSLLPLSSNTSLMRTGVLSLSAPLATVPEDLCFSPLLPGGSLLSWDQPTTHMHTEKHTMWALIIITLFYSVIVADGHACTCIDAQVLLHQSSSRLLAVSSTSKH